MSNPEYTGGENFFDPSTFVTTSPLNGKRGVILPGTVIARRPYSLQKGGDDQTLLVVNVAYVSPEGQKTRNMLISCGALWPGLKNNGVLEKATSGAYFVGKAERRSNFADFFNNLKASGFNMGELGAKGVVALDFADITWKAIEKKVGGEMKPYDVPAEFHGYVDPATVAGISTVAASGASPAPTGNGHAQDADLIPQVIAAVQAAVKQHGEIPRGQLAIKVGPLLSAVPAASKSQAFTLLMDNEVLGKIPGISFDAKTVKAATV